MKNFGNWFWGSVLAVAVLSIGAGFLSGSSLPGARSMPAAIKVPEIAPAPIERSLFGARGPQASLEALEPPIDDAVVDRPAGWAPAMPPSQTGPARLAIVICDMGTDETLDRRFSAIPFQLSFAVEAGGNVPKDVQRSDDLALLVQAEPSTPLDRLSERFSAMHAGGVITPLAGEPSDAEALVTLLAGSKAFLIDGMANGSPQFYEAARDEHVAAASRDIVIDAYEEQSYVDYMLRQAVRLARRTGVAIAVGHAYPETYEALRRNLDHLVADNDVQIVPVGELVR